ncbi:MAG: tetratricopeptide repeat protein [Aureispira sp.]|nr:tetratricopeptide repeat protein [Aureispira sp.]
MKLILLSLLILQSFSLFAQDNKELAWNKAKEALKLMDNGKIEESISLLEECKKLDPEEFTYPYEIAYANVLKKDYKTAIKILNKVKKYKKLNSQVYQMSGNCYSHLGNSKKAIKEYETGMKQFPNSGNLHLEKGNVFLNQKMYSEAVINYKNGIKVDPMYPSNYYRLALIYLNSNNKLNGLIYGEIFMNIERTTPRTQEISGLLYKTYKESMTFSEDGTKAELDFCDITLSIEDLEKGNLTLPLCAAFGKNFILGTLGHNKINLGSLSKIRNNFIDLFFKEDYKEYPNVLFEYHKTLVDNGFFEAYNYYILQIGAPEEFQEWLKSNQETFDKFVDWYTENKNIISVDLKNRFVD